MQNSLVMADFHSNGDDFSKIRFKKEKENLVKADVMLVKQNVMLPTMLLAPENKCFPKNCESKEKYVRRKIFKTRKEPEICKSTNKLNRKMESLPFEETVNKNKNLLKDKISAPPGFPKYPCLENNLSQSTLHHHPKLRSSPIFASSSTKNSSSSDDEKTLSEYNSFEKSLPVEKKDLALQVKVQNSCDSFQKKVSNKVENKVQNLCLKNGQNSSNQSITKQKSENGKSKYSDTVKDNIINIFTLADGHRSNSSLSNYLIDSIQNKVCTSAFNQEKHVTFDNKSDYQKSSLIDKNCTATSILKNDKNNLDCHVKYSWQDIENWIPPAQKEEISKAEKSNLECKVTYSWQVLGISTQTSLQLLQNVDEDHENDRYKCSIKYSWQIVGKSTQISLNDYENHLSLNGDYWKGSILPPRVNYNKWNKIKSPIEFLNKKKTIILYSEGTQTLSDKRTQTELTDCRVKYSWENLIEQHLKSLESSKFDASEEISYDKYCVDNLKIHLEPIKFSAKYSWQNLIRQRLREAKY